MRTLSLFCLLILCCSLAAGASALTVTGVSPAVAYADSARTYDVYGTGFAVGAQVTLTPSAGGTAIAATGEDWVDFTHLRCTVTVPAGAVTGLYDVTVSNPRDTGSGSMANAFSVYPRPVVTGIVPSQAPILSSPSPFAAHLSGTGFVTGAEVYLVGGTGGITWIFATGETVTGPTRLDCTFSVPYDAYPGPYDVYVRSHPNLDYVLARTDAFTVIAPTPAITLVSPASAFPGQTLTIDVVGSGFTNGAEVRVEGGPSGSLTMIPAMGETFVSPFRIQCGLAIPADADIGQYTVFLRNPGGDWVYRSNAFTVTAPVPTVTAISPRSADPGQTLSTVYVTGTGFVAGVEVRLEADDTEDSLVINATDEVRVNATTVRCALAIPASAPPGPYLVFARNPGTAWSAPGPFSFGVHTPEPAVAGILPREASPGQALSTVYVTGSGFAGGAQVRIRGGTGGTTEIGATGETWVNASAIRCSITVPFDAWPGPYAVEVMNLYGGWVSRPGSFAVVAPTPTISGVSPPSAYPGQTLAPFNVSGTGLAQGAEVRVEGGTGGTTMVEATGETFVSPAQVRCTLPIPENAYPGRYGVSVRNPGGQWATYAGAFFVNAPIPFVYGTAPASAAPGETLPTVYVHASGLTNGAQVVLVGGPGDGVSIEAGNETFINLSTMRCSLAIPPDAPPGTYTVCIRMPGNPDHLYEGVLDTFTVTAPVPTVTGISPDRAFPGDTLSTVYVRGTGFASGAEVALVNGPGIQMPTIAAEGETWVNATTVRCSLAIPADTFPGSFDIAVRNPGGDRVLLADAFTVLPPVPTVTGISPATAAPDTVGDFSVSGTGFAFGATVEIRGRAGSAPVIRADASWVNATTILCRLVVPPDAPPGPCDVFVRNPTGDWVSRAGAFTIVAPAPTVTGVSPDSASPGSVLDTVYVFGTGFANGAQVAVYGGTLGSTTVYAQAETFVNSTAIRCSLAFPLNASPGPYSVGVLNPGGTWISRTQAFTIVAPTPTVTGISPDTGRAGETLTGVRVTGTGFAVGAWVLVRNDLGANSTMITGTGVTWISPTEVRCTLAIPANASPGPYMIWVGNLHAGSGSRAGAFTVLAPAPTVTGISPASAHAGEMLTGVHVYGTNFTPGAEVAIEGGTTEVYATDEIVLNSTTIRCTMAIPLSASPGPYNVHVWNPGQEWGFKAGAFTVLAPAPAVLAVPPSTLLPTDTDGDRLYDDVNGNGRKDFADVVLYFNQMTWIALNEPVALFDCNGNGRIDFADVVWLFNHL